MSTHLTDEQLQDHLFQLLEDRPALAHLAECDQCAIRLDAVRVQFAQLDLLKDDPQVRDELVAETMELLSAASPKRFDHWAALAAGLVLLAGLLWMFSGRLAVERDQLVTDDPLPTVDPAPAPREVPPDILAELRKTTPFVPGSNIELNVLPRRENVQLTIYNEANLTQVKDQRQLTLKKGWNWLQFMWVNTQIDPTSLQLEPRKWGGKVEVQQLVYPPRMQGVGRWLIFSEVSGQVPFTITYLTAGIEWHAFYQGTLSSDEQRMRLQGYVRVENNSGEDYEDAQTRLIVGKVNVIDRIGDLAQRVHAYGSPLEKGASSDPASLGLQWRTREFDKLPALNVLFASGAVDLSITPKEIVKEGLSEYFLYTIEGRETIPHEWAKRLPSFDVANVPVKSFYRYHDTEFGSRMQRYIKFTNDEAHLLGDTPMPNGGVKVFHQLDEAQHLSYVGAANTPYIPVGEEAKWRLGEADKVTIEVDRMNYATENHTFDGEGNINGWDEIFDYQLAVKNARNLPVEVELNRMHGGENKWDVAFPPTEGVTYERLDVTQARFEARLAAGEKKNIRYQLTIRHGEREHQK